MQDSNIIIKNIDRSYAKAKRDLLVYKQQSQSYINQYLLNLQEKGYFCYLYLSNISQQNSNQIKLEFMENKQEIYGAVENIIQEKLIDNMEFTKQQNGNHNNILLPSQ